jgi:acyl carrier protein
MKTKESIAAQITKYVISNHPCEYTEDNLPKEESLVELGVLDSYGVVELVVFLEATWSISIHDDEITREKMGSIKKMSALVVSKLLI